MGVTIHDVARAAGVSVASASRALSGRRKVTPDIAERVARAAAELGYQPNAVAKALRDQTTGTIGMIVPGIGNPFFTTIVEAVEHQLQQTGRDLLLCASQYRPDIEARRLDTLLARRVDGLIISPCDIEASVPAVLNAARRVPLVQVDRHIEGGGADWVGVDDDSALAQAVDHVAEGGARRVVFVGSRLMNSSARSRLSGFERAAARAGVATAPPLLGEFTLEWGIEAGRLLLGGDAMPDAVICGNDQIAVGLVRALRMGGVRVPDDVSVVGFDDVGHAAMCDPPLTTVRQPVEEMAAEAVRLLGQVRMGAPRPAQRVAIAPQLVVRETSRPVTAGGGKEGGAA
ncbi:LacI family DNA-binding transcriptional regulator [Microtetraspora sp. NBRC 16547]|uniref:LacI family DNA-binding transcriptional regulator n=1 Tax=Microtetraspora sp. NBRC 16547 TaxID=3030993 RepID=UPI0024A0C3BE|nr:LacI family DNA-binding transcriptional regulator [Microtetraspora sp. NBRC 16547]GLW99248.1 ribose operon repressor RbsR [Microtetraspora sp. NBRC 16547]